MSLKEDIENAFYAFNDLKNEHEQTGEYNAQKADRAFRELTKLKDAYTTEETDLDILAVLNRKQKAKQLKSDQLPNEVYWYLNKKGFFTLLELSTLVAITQEAMRGRVFRGEPPASRQTPVGKKITEGQEVEAQELLEDSLQSLIDLRNTKGIAVRDRLELEKEINKRSSDTLNKQVIEKKKQLEDVINWIINVLIENVNKSNREALREATRKIKEGGDAEHLIVDIRPLFKKALEDGIFKPQSTS